MTVDQAIEALVQIAVEHEKSCDDTADHNEDCPGHQCWDHRQMLAARVMHALDLAIEDLGFVADQLLMVRWEEPAEDEVLDANEIGGN